MLFYFYATLQNQGDIFCIRENVYLIEGLEIFYGITNPSNQNLAETCRPSVWILHY